MTLANLTPMTREECENITGGAFPFLIGAILVGGAITVIKNLWNSSSGQVKISKGLEAKWDNKQEDSKKEVKALKEDFKKLQDKITQFIRPFYEI